MDTPTILIISTNPRIEGWLTTLREAGMDAHLDTMSNMLVAIHTIAPQLLIIDVSGGVGDAAALIGLIHGDGERRALPIILFGCHADERERTLGLDAGADDFLAGQLSTRELVARIRAVLRRIR